MPTLALSRFALFAMLGALLIPIGTSSLRGLTHVLTCHEEANTPFQLIISDAGPPTVITSTKIERGEEQGLCGGLLLDMRARTRPEEHPNMIVLITNNTSSPWRGTVQLRLEKLRIPVGIGAIRAGETRSDTIPLRLDPGPHDLTGSLLIGP